MAFFATNTEVPSIWPTEVTTYFSIKNIMHAVDGGVSCIPCRIHFVFEAWSGKKTSNPIFEVKVDKGLDWQ